MSNWGDILAGGIVYGTFSTRSNGIMTNLSGGTISVYKNDSATQSTAGVTLTAPFDSVVGFNSVKIDTSADGTFYANGGFFSVVITAGTVGGVDVSGTTVGNFTLGFAANCVWDALRAAHLVSLSFGAATTTFPTNFPALMITAGGYVAIDWANINAPTTTQVLSGTTISTSQVVASVTGAVGSVTGAVGSVTAPVAITSNIKKNQALPGFPFPMTNPTTGGLQTGLTVTGQVRKDTGSFGALTNAVTEIGTTGVYTVDLAAADTNGNTLCFLFTATGGNPNVIFEATQP